MKVRVTSFILLLIFTSAISQDAYFYIGSNSYVTLQNGVKFDVNGKAIIKADSNSFGSLVIDDNPSTELNVSGDTDVELYLTYDQWHIISPPISDAVIGTFLNIYLRIFDETIDTAGGGIYYQNNWIYIYTPISMPMNTMKGYSVWNQNAIGKHIYTYPGTLNNGPLSFSAITNSGPGTPEGWNLVGNPYPCYIDLDATSGWTYSNVDASVYFWDVSQYKVYSAAGLGGIGDGTASRYIHSNQGFFIKCNNTSGGYIGVTNEVRTHGSSEFYKNNKTLNELLRLKVYGNNDEDEVIVHFNDNATTGYDGQFDAYKLYGLLSAPQLYTLTPDTDSINLTINTIKRDSSLVTIPLCIEVGNPGTYNLVASNLGSFPYGVKIILEDMKLGIQQDLTNITTYSFDAQTDDNRLRFLLKFDYSSASTEESYKEEPFELYVSDKTIFIDITDELEYPNIRIFDIIGRELIKKPGLPGLNIFNLKNKPQGIYVINIETKTSIYSKKVYVY